MSVTEWFAWLGLSCYKFQRGFEKSLLDSVHTHCYHEEKLDC